MAERVFLHVGAPKTGTTYLQQMLWGNRNALKQHGILLPATRKAHYQAMGDLRGGVWYDAHAWWTWDRLVAKAKAWHGTVVISEEMLGAATPSQAKRAVESLQPAEVHVVVAGRDLGRTIPSSWQQGIRARSLGRYSAYVTALRTGKYQEFWAHQTPLPILRRWADDLPVTQRHLVTVPPDGADPSLLWQRFAGVIGIEEGLCEERSSPSNTSLGVVETELLRRVNNALGDAFPLRAPYLGVVHGHLVNPILKRRKSVERFGAPVELTDWIVETAEQMAEEVRRYDCDVAGDPADLVPAQLRTGTDPDEVSDEALLDAAVETIVGMLKHTNAVTRRMKPAEADMTRKLRQFTVRTKRRLGSAADRFRRIA